MRRKTICLIILVFAFNCVNAMVADTVSFGTFGKVLIYKPVSVVNSVVLFISGEKGWNHDAMEMANPIINQGAIVVGIDIRYYLKKLTAEHLACYYPAGDLEELSLMLQKKYKLSQYFKPILIGYSSGATLVYGALAQAPANTFKGALALAFSADIAVNKPLCRGSGLKQHPLRVGKLYHLEPSDRLSEPFIILHGSRDKVCSLAVTQEFSKHLNSGKLIELQGVGHEFSLTSAWLGQFTEAFRIILNAPSFAERKASQNQLLHSQKLVPLAGDFPVVIISAPRNDTRPMVFLISGDGGWTSFDNAIAEALATKGMPVAGLDAQKYFWNAKTPEETSMAISRAIQHFMQQWNTKKFVLAGYSFGACVVPFIADRLPAFQKELLQGVFCLSPDVNADFEIHISDMLNLGNLNEPYNVPHEIAKIKQLHPVCIFGIKENAKTRTQFAETVARIITLPGDHHYNDDPAVAADAIIKEIK